jgi:hypothetical protein
LEESSLLLPDLGGEAGFSGDTFDLRKGLEALDGLDFFTLVFLGAISLRYHPCIEVFKIASNQKQEIWDHWVPSCIR